MNFFQNIYIYLKFFFEKLSFRSKPKEDLFYIDDSGHTEFEYEFMPLKYDFIPINEKMER
jgi:hypothetical protein